jgi:8-oxo-dGTP diphosphatase
MARPVTPPVAVDVIIELLDVPARRIVLIERANPPHGWALPGGFVDAGETLEQAARREMREETGLDVHLTALLGCYSNPARDPRGHTIGIVFIGEASGQPVGGDDAALARAFDPLSPPPLAFDHADILRDYVAVRARREHGGAEVRHGASVCAPAFPPAAAPPGSEGVTVTE